MILALLSLLAFHPDQEPCRACDTLTAMAAALSDNDGVKFMAYLDKSTPGYYDIEANVNALTAQQDVAASLDVLEETGDDQQAVDTVDWFLMCTSQDGLQVVTRRRMRVKVSARKEGKHWMVTAIDPRSIVDPIAATPSLKK
jgi:hypothetical protein